MTLIAAFNSPGVGLVIADSQETVTLENGDQYKYSVLKIKPETIGEFEFSISGGGNGDAIDSFIETFKRRLAVSKSKILSDFRSLFEKELQRCRRNLKKVDDDTAMHFIVAARTKQEFGLWKASAGTLITVNSDKPSLIGFTSQMYQHMADSMYTESLPITQRILVGLRVLEFARVTCTCVDRPYTGIVCGKYGFHVLDDKLLSEMTQSLLMFGAWLDRLLLASSDTSMESAVFSHQLQEFKDTAEQLRHDYLQTIGTIDFMKLIKNGIGYGIAFTPPGTSMTAEIDPKTGQMKPIIVRNFLSDEPSKS